MREPDGPGRQETVWERLQREDREDARRSFWPLVLIRTAILYFLLPILADAFGRPLPQVALWVVVCLALGQLLIGWLWYRSHRRNP